LFDQRDTHQGFSFRAALPSAPFQSCEFLLPQKHCQKPALKISKTGKLNSTFQMRTHVPVDKYAMDAIVFVHIAVLGWESFRLMWEIAAVFKPRAKSSSLQPLTDDREAYAMYNMLVIKAGVRTASGKTMVLIGPGEQKAIARSDLI
jgi:hypothetical protein